MKFLIPNKNFIYFLILVFFIQLFLLLLAGIMFMDGAGNYQSAGNFVLNIWKYVFGAPIYWFLDFEKHINNLNFSSFLIFILNTYLQWIIYSSLMKK